MKRTLKIMLAVVCVSVLMLSGCGAGPYVGKYISSSWPHSRYEEMPVYDQLVFSSSDGTKTTIQYEFFKKGENSYCIKGEFFPAINHMEYYKDASIYVLMIDKGVIIESIRVNTKEGVGKISIPFEKSFETDKKFKYLSFTYNVQYMY